MKLNVFLAACSFTSLVSANYSFTAWSGNFCNGSKLAQTSGGTFDGYCHDVRGRGWHSIGGQAASIKGEKVQFYVNGDCTGTGFNVDDTSNCGVLSSPHFQAEIGSWRATK